MEAYITKISTRVGGFTVRMKKFTELMDFWLNEEEKAFAERVIPKTGIETKYWTVNPAEYFNDNGKPRFVGHTERQRDWRESATKVCSDIALTLLLDGSVNDLGLISFNSTTGYANPDIPAKVADRLSLGHHVRRTQILGQGCYGSIPNLTRCVEAVESGRVHTALMLASELCSYTFQPHTKDYGYIIAAILFGDGTVGATISREGEYRIVDYETYTDYFTFKEMSFELEDEGFRFILTDKVPGYLGKYIMDPMNRLLERNNLSLNDIDHWLIHPGGMAIVREICKTLGIELESLEETLYVNRNFGNMSSTTIFFVLNELMRSGKWHTGENTIMVTFGPGLTIECVLLRRE